MEDIDLFVGDYESKKIIDKYEYGELLLTYKSQNIFLTKRIKKKKLDDKVAYKNYVINEIDILNKISHKNIIKLKKLFVAKRHYYIIMEYCNGEKTSRKFGKI